MGHPHVLKGPPVRVVQVEGRLTHVLPPVGGHRERSPVGDVRDALPPWRQRRGVARLERFRLFKCGGRGHLHWHRCG
eukprot:1179154-Prorocentrum_minimum.AAC.1